MMSIPKWLVMFMWLKTRDKLVFFEKILIKPNLARFFLIFFRTKKCLSLFAEKEPEVVEAPIEAPPVKQIYATHFEPELVVGILKVFELLSWLF